MKKIVYLLLFTGPLALLGQSTADSLPGERLKEVSIRARRVEFGHLEAIQGTYLWSGKKSEVISLAQSPVNIAAKVPRQVFARVPGLFVYDIEGTANQVNISTRGLDPHRGWEYNVRTNGWLTNSDLYGYPASHFTLPFEAVERIELVRGTGALQYGAQFGGMLNYIIKRPDTSRVLSAESINSIGSFGWVSTFNAIGGRKGRWEYYAYYSRRFSNGYRENSRSEFDGQGLLVRFQASERLSMRAEMFRSSYFHTPPGPLTDAQFAENPRQATRRRNYFSPELFLPAFGVDWKIGPHTRLSCTTSGVFGPRASVLFDRPATIRDTINPITLQYDHRLVHIDDFNSRTSELRLLHEYALSSRAGSALVVGVQYIHNDMRRRQLGRGTTGTDYTLSIGPEGWGRDMWMRTRNLALFAENRFQLTSRLFVTPGARLELGASRLEGNVAYLPPEDIRINIRRNFPLLGINAGYELNPQQTLYTGWSQAYRPVLFQDLVPANPYERADPNIRDGYGFNAELGWRGRSGPLRWDVSAFRLDNNRRVGNLALYYERLDTVILWRTNIGNSRTYGLELLLEYQLRLGENAYLNAFTATSWMQARYLGDSIRVGAKENRSIAGKRVESVPEWISRNGLSFHYKEATLSLLYSYTASSFADPLNTVQPNATGSVGLVPDYGLLDLNINWQVLPQLTLRLSVNNLTDKQYFTKRPVFYPGPGIWPSDGRNFTLMAQLRW